MRHNTALAMVLFVAVLVAACTGHKVDVQQGNIVDPELLQELEVGMSTKQVLFLLGSPVVRDPFHPSRWDYIYYLSEAGTIPETTKRLTLYFENDQLVRIVDRYFTAVPTPAPQSQPDEDPG